MKDTLRKYISFDVFHCLVFPSTCLYIKHHNSYQYGNIIYIYIRMKGLAKNLLGLRTFRVCLLNCFFSGMNFVADECYIPLINLFNIVNNK